MAAKTPDFGALNFAETARLRKLKERQPTRWRGSSESDLVGAAQRDDTVDGTMDGW